MIKFSIITVTRNAAGTLEKAIASIAAQRYDSHEYIIVDGASSDATAAIVQRHRDVVTNFVSEPDQGIYDAMNKGLALARGDFVYFLGADDYLIDDRVLADVAAFLDRYPDTDLVYGGIEVRSGSGEVTNFMPPPPGEALQFMICGCLPHQASFASRRAMAITGGFDPRYRIAGDYDWFLRVLTAPELNVRRVERNVASYHMGGLSNRLRDSQAEVYAIQNSLPLYDTTPWLRRRVRAFQRSLWSHRRLLKAQVAVVKRTGVQRFASRLELAAQYLGGSFMASVASRRALERRLTRIQKDVLDCRIANDATI